MIATCVLALLLPLAACGGESVPAADRLPSDFEVSYQWLKEGDPSNLQDVYFTCRIVLSGDGSGAVSYTLRDLAGGTFSGSVPFDVSEASIRALYATMHDIDLFTRTWTEAERWPGRYGTSSITVVADGRTYVVPDLLEDRDLVAVIRPLYEQLQAIVPEPVWAQIEAARAEQLAQSGAASIWLPEARDCAHGCRRT